jgi:methyl-accepting chemotaxis protein
MQTLADGNTATEVFGAGRGDEIGLMARTVQIFKDNMIAREKAEADIAEQRRVSEEQRAAPRGPRAQGDRGNLRPVRQGCRGNLDTRLNEADKEGFLLTISQRLNGLTGMLQEVTARTAGHRDRQHGTFGDLTKDIRGEYRGIFGTVKDGVNAMAAKLRDIRRQAE